MADVIVRESCTWECSPGCMPPICSVCNDNRFVTTRPTARRYLGGSTPSEVFPCPACGKFIFDSEGKRYGVPGRRYGNPLLEDDEDYGRWKARNRRKAIDWQKDELFASEQAQAKHLRMTYPAADLRWVRLWVLGERNVIETP